MNAAEMRLRIYPLWGSLNCSHFSAVFYVRAFAFNFQDGGSVKIHSVHRRARGASDGPLPFSIQNSSTRVNTK